LADSSARADFERFFVGAKRSLMGQAFLLTGDIEGSKDLVQEALLRVWREWPRASAYEDPTAFARRVLHNLAIDRWRQDKGRLRLARGAERPSPSPPPGIGHLDIIRSLHRLPVNEQRALVLHDVVGLSVNEVAADLEVPEGTVRSWLSRGRTALATELGLDRARAGEGAGQ
jgi:RNA polymerase sigma-70 factor (ECF subfamily)